MTTANKFQPTLTFDQPEDYRRAFERATSRGQLQSSWKDNQDNDSATECWSSEGEYWINQTDLGAIRFTQKDQAIQLYPEKNIDSEQFRASVTHYWLPLVYQVWGLLVFHASAVVQRNTGQSLLFIGRGESGKSTMAYGMGKYPEWQQIADDSVALSVRGTQFELSYIPNEVNLRHPSRHFFGSESAQLESIGWPSSPPVPKAIYWIDANHSGKDSFSIDRLGIRQAYLKLLEHAYFFSEKLSENTHKSGKDLLKIARQIPLFRLTYPKEFREFQPVLAAIQKHAK